MKKKLPLILIFAIVLSMLATPVAFAFDFSQNVPNDTDMHWAETNIDTLKSLGIMLGSDGYITPDSNVTRGEFTALVSRAFHLTAAVPSGFGDVDSNNIFSSTIAAAHQAGIINGYSDNTFRPNNKITREEIMLMISRLSKTGAQTSIKFSDIGFGYQYTAALSTVIADGIIGGYPDNTFRPNNNTTRAEAATIILSAVKAYSAPASNEEITAKATEYLKLYFGNYQAAAAMVSGSAQTDWNYTNYVYNELTFLGYAITNTVSDIAVQSVSSEGGLAKCILTYTVNCSVTGGVPYVKQYKGQSDIRLRYTDGAFTVYEHTTQIFYPKSINLTWEIYTTAPTSATPGVNVVSPTCFQIASSETRGISNNIYADSSIALKFNNTLSQNYIDYANANGYDVWAMYKTDFTLATEHAFLNNAYSRQQACNLLIENILKYSLDGINFDFENIYTADKGAYTNHVREISLMAHCLGIPVSVDVTKYEPTSSVWSMCYNRDALAKYADYIALMAYDQYYSASKVAGPVAGLDWTEDCIELTLKEVPQNKLILAMPFYIRYWNVENGVAKSSKAVSMDAALQLINDNGATAEYNANYQLTKYSWKMNGKNYVLWMENAQSTAARVNLSKKYGLAGVASWRRGFETSDVWDAISSALFN